MAIFNKKKGAPTSGHSGGRPPLKLDMSKRPKKEKEDKKGKEEPADFRYAYTSNDTGGATAGEMQQDAVDRLIARERAAKNRTAATYTSRKNELRETEAAEQRRLAERRKNETPPGEGFVKKR